LTQSESGGCSIETAFDSVFWMGEKRGEDADGKLALIDTLFEKDHAGREEIRLKRLGGGGGVGGFGVGGGGGGGGAAAKSHL